VAIRNSDPERAAQARTLIDTLHPTSVEEFSA
jgi:hypothetical protein